MESFEQSTDPTFWWLLQGLPPIIINPIFDRADGTPFVLVVVIVIFFITQLYLNNNLFKSWLS